MYLYVEIIKIGQAFEELEMFGETGSHNKKVKRVKLTDDQIKELQIGDKEIINLLCLQDD